MPLEKIPAILLIGVGLHISLTAPTPPTPKNERRMEEGPIDINWLARVMKGGYWIFAIIEICILVAGTTKPESTWSKRLVDLLLPNGKHPDCIRLTPTTIFSMILLLLGAALRYWCFREMGKHFTFHVTLLKDHKLVTSGPYSIVRHPAYTGGVFLSVGQLIWYMARGSWLRESMVHETKLESWLLIAPVMFAIFAVLVCIHRRIPVEDEALRRRFGKEWDAWAEAVPYRLFPGVY